MKEKTFSLKDACWYCSQLTQTDLTLWQVLILESLKNKKEYKESELDNLISDFENDLI